MNLDIDGGKILYALGIAFALGAFAYFVRDVVFGLSITVKAALLFVTFLAFLVVGFWIERGALDVVAYALAALAYFVFLAYIITRYDPSETGVFLLFTVSAALFVGLGYVVRQGELSIPDRTVGYVLFTLVAVGLVLVGADVVSGEVTYTAELDDEATFTVPEGALDADGPEVVPLEGGIGTLTARNEGVFTRPLTLPSIGGCVVGTDAVSDDVRVRFRYQPPSYERADRLAGGEELEHEIHVEIPVQTNATDDGSMTFAIERGDDCDVSREEPTIVVIVGEDAREVRPPLVVGRSAEGVD
ncbi:hypothetical protein ACERIT_11010 [Halopenitus sp. H-Gu1]|uniref:hypothetical protein n=1 Tax=Halopenitus sp. H-Gu1 TaxID=3242697 RepID=UPI00359E7326